MGEQKIEVRKPLFDRLVDFDPRLRELHHGRTLDRRGLRESVRRELEQLFNTRCPVPSHRLSVRERSVIDYGIPDFSIFSARNFDHRKQLAEILRRAIEAYEPRLAHPRVTVEPIGGDSLEAHVALEAHIEGVLVVDNIPEPVLFTTRLDGSSGKADVHART